MEKKDIEKKLHELRVLQSDFLKKKKAERNTDEIEKIRAERNNLKKKAYALYRKKSK